MKIRVGLVYPNIYRTAMSSLGYQIMYNLFNERNDTFCERIVYPETKSLETKSKMKNFNIISFSLQYEQDYFNVLEMLKNSNIPLKSKDRNENDPLIIAGGPCASSNPMPLADYIDIFFIGECDLILNKFLDKYLKSKKNLEDYLKIKNLYIPTINNEANLAIVNNMDEAYHITTPIIIETENKNFKPVFNNSIMLNISRGCTRGCRFCMSGYLYRPKRETSINKLLNIAETTRAKYNLNKVTLISAGVSDYSKIDELIEELSNRGFQISTPSMRIETITKKVLKSLKKSGLKTLTIAPESIYKIRKKINKDISDELIFNLVKNAVELGFNLKLYIIIGFPNESKEDIKELIEFIKKINSIGNNKVSIKFSVNPLVPKPHTPFQWEKYDLKDIKSKMRYMKKELSKINIKYDSPKNGLIQYVLSCGDRSVGSLIEDSLYRNINLKEWNEKVIDYSIDSELPWAKINIPITKKFLKNEYEKSEEEKQTKWCEQYKCYNCGSCNQINNI